LPHDLTCTGVGPGTLSNKVNGGNVVDERLRKGPPAPLPVDVKQPNPFGLYNVLGNASEWTRDVYASRQPGEQRVTVRIDPARTLSRGLDS